MIRATVVGYTALLALFLSVAVSGYWAFGAAAQVGLLQLVSCQAAFCQGMLSGWVHCRSLPGTCKKQQAALA